MVILLGQWGKPIDPLPTDIMKLRRILVYGFLAIISFILLALVIGIIIAENTSSVDDLSAWIGLHVKVGETRYSQLQQLLGDELQDLRCVAEENEKRTENTDNISTASAVKCVTRTYNNFDGSNLIERVLNYLLTLSYYSIQFQFQDNVLHNIEIVPVRLP